MRSYVPVLLLAVLAGLSLATPDAHSTSRHLSDAVHFFNLAESVPGLQASTEELGAASIEQLKGRKGRLIKHLLKKAKHVAKKVKKTAKKAGKIFNKVQKFASTVVSKAANGLLVLTPGFRKLVQKWFQNMNGIYVTQKNGELCVKIVGKTKVNLASTHTGQRKCCTCNKKSQLELKNWFAKAAPDSAQRVLALCMAQKCKDCKALVRNSAIQECMEENSCEKKDEECKTSKCKTCKADCESKGKQAQKGCKDDKKSSGASSTSSSASSSARTRLLSWRNTRLDFGNGPVHMNSAESSLEEWNAREDPREPERPFEELMGKGDAEATEQQLSGWTCG